MAVHIPSNLADLKQLAESATQLPDKDEPGTSEDLDVLEEWLREHYEFRFDDIKCVVEYRRAAQRPASKREEGWGRISDYDLHSMLREIRHARLMDGQKLIRPSRDNVYQLLSSSFSPKFNPVKEYFKNLPAPGEEDHIQKLADTIKTDTELWKPFLTRWLVSCVANSLTPHGCQNHLCLVLTGGQGKGKTTWLNKLCPQKLNDYLYVGKVDLKNKDVYTLLAETFIINLDDQLHSIQKKDEDEIKTFITLPEVKYRRPYDRFITAYPRIANFCASVNRREFLTDVTGARRFLPFEVIDIDKPAINTINIDLVWAQAKKIYESGERYWFNEDEIDQLNEYNEDFKMTSPELEGCGLVFNIPELGDPLQYLSVTDIKQKLETLLLLRNTSLKKIGEAMSQLGFIKKQRVMGKKRIWVYMVTERSHEEIMAVRTSDPEKQSGGGLPF